MFKCQTVVQVKGVELGGALKEDISRSSSIANQSPYPCPSRWGRDGMCGRGEPCLERNVASIRNLEASDGF